MTSTHSKRVVLLDDHSLFVESLELALRLEGYDARHVDLPPHATAATLLAEILRRKPRTLLLDLDLGSHGGGLRLIRPAAREGIAVVILTASTDRARWGECLANGACRVISKMVPLAAVLTTVHRIDDGLPVMTRLERDELLEIWQNELSVQKDARARLGRLTRREAEVLGHLMGGHQVSDIARQRFVSESTIRTQVKSVLAKLQVSSQLSAVGLAHGVGWHAPEAQESVTVQVDRIAVPPQRH